jgi:hypothetical protein
MKDVPEGVEDAVADLFDMVMEALDKWEEKIDKSEGFREDVVINTAINVLSVLTMEYGYKPEFIIHAVLTSLRINGAFDDEPTVH